MIQLLYFMRISLRVGKARQIEKRSARSRPIKQIFSIQNNQLYNIAGYLYSIRALFAIYLVQLDNKAEYQVH